MTRCFVLGLLLLVHGLARASGAESCRSVVDEFEKYWPCTRPSEELLEQARASAECLGRLLEASEDERVSLAAYELLTRAEARGYKEVVLAAVRDERAELRGRAVHDLPQVLASHKLVDEYVRLLADSSLLVRYNAVEGLAQHPTPPVARRLMNMLSDESIEVRHLALHTIGSWHLPETREELIRLSRGSDPLVSGVATLGLIRYYKLDVDLAPIDTYLTRELRRLVGPPYSGTGEVVVLIGVLGRDQNPGRFSSLHMATEHMHGDVRAAAQEALRSGSQNRSRPHNPRWADMKNTGRPNYAVTAPVRRARHP